MGLDYLQNGSGEVLILTLNDVLKSFWYLSNNEQRLKFLLDKIECPDAVFKEMLEDEQFVVFLFRNLELLSVIEGRFNRINGLAQMKYARILPVGVNIMAMRKRLNLCLEGTVVEEVQLSVGSQILNLVFKVTFWLDGRYMYELDEEVNLDNDVVSVFVIGKDSICNEIMTTGDAEIAGCFGLYLIESNKRVSADFYLKRAVELGANCYQLAYAANLFALAVTDGTYLDSCLQAWENITVLDARYYLDLIKLFGGNLELAFLCLEKLHPYYLNKLLVKLNEVELKDNNIQDKLVGIIKDLLLIYHCRKSNHDTLPN